MGSSLFSEVAKILLGYKLKQASLKTLIYASEYGNSRQLFAMTNECAKYQPLLEQVLKLCPKDYIQDESIAGDKELALVYLYEYLLGRKFGRNVGMRKMMLRYKQGIKKAVDEVLTQLPGARNLADVLKGGKANSSQKIPRYMRVNLLKRSVQSAIESLQAEEWDYVGELSTDKFKESVSAMSKFQFGRDPFLSDVLVFPVATDLHNHPMTQSGILIQQDRASCVPAHVLGPPQGAIVLDCCAAPGNKTTHLASLMRDSGQVIALDRDQKRLTILKAMVEKSGASTVSPVHQDFLTLQPDSEDAKDIQFILVDPSCSGSGMRCQDDHNAAASDDALRSRLQTLKRFQISILKHALRFPAVRRVVYSTCSMFCQENEEVVTEVMAHVSGYFEFEPVLPHWPVSRGLPGFSDSSCFLRLKPENDLTQGFFVACFKRMKEREAAGEDTTEGKSCRVEEEREESAVKAGDDVLEEDGKRLKKMKKKRDREMLEGGNEDVCLEGSDVVDENEVNKKIKKNKQEKEMLADEEVNVEVSDRIDKKRKKHKKHKKEVLQDEINEVSLLVIDESDEVNKKRKKKKKHKKEKLEDEIDEVRLELPAMVDDNDGSRNKNEKKRKCTDNSDEESSERKKKKKEKKKKHREASVDCVQSEDKDDSSSEESKTHKAPMKSKHKKKKKSKKSENEI